MAENRKDQQSGRGMEQSESQQQQSSQEYVSNSQSGSNPQSGSQWDNNRTRELSAGDMRPSRSESEDTDIVESGLGIDE
ncbi:MAG: hypothetical protein JWP27_3025 [Flaviaesturariibacter sp.]|nr:hypothetical protein [Flaviaesturariibacter sp.]